MRYWVSKSGRKIHAFDCTDQGPGPIEYGAIPEGRPAPNWPNWAGPFDSLEEAKAALAGVDPQDVQPAQCCKGKFDA